MKRIFISVMLIFLGFSNAHSFDHKHSAWDRLLEKHVIWINNGTASQVDYAGFMKDREKLKSYLDTLSEVDEFSFDRWTYNERLAFLINAYNAFTIELILTSYPDIQSIKDLATFFKTPWKKRFFTLFGKKRNLDEIEHKMIRKPGVFEEPLIHFAVNCASIGCPAIRDEAYKPKVLEKQLLDNCKRFLSDRTRNRFNPKNQSIEISQIFEWYREDFSEGFRGYTGLKTFFSLHADWITDTRKDEIFVKNRKENIIFLDYDWHLNDRK